MNHDTYASNNVLPSLVDSIILYTTAESSPLRNHHLYYADRYTDDFTCKLYEFWQ